MKMTRYTTIGLIALGVALAAWLLVMFVFAPEAKLAPGAADDSHCPECGHALPGRLAETGGECPFCKMQGKTVPVGRGRRSAARGPAVPLALGGLIGALLVVHGVFLVRQRMAARQQHEDLYYVNCRKCDRRLRYRERQVGQLAKCPACRTVIMFPKLPEAPKSVWPARLFRKLLRR